MNAEKESHARTADGPQVPVVGEWMLAGIRERRWKTMKARNVKTP